MSKSWSEVIENIDLSTKPLREPRKLSCDEITDLKEKCNPKYDLTILDLICTIEALQQENEQLREQLDEWKYEVKCHMDEVIAREKQIEQLRAQVARMKEALELCSWYGSEGLCIDEKLARKIMKALRPDSGTDYHNPTKKR